MATLLSFGLTLICLAGFGLAMTFADMQAALAWAVIVAGSLIAGAISEKGNG